MEREPSAAPGCSSWLTWVALIALISTFVGFTILRGVLHGASASSGLLTALAYVGIVVTVAAVGVRRDRRKAASRDAPKSARVNGDVERRATLARTVLDEALVSLGQPPAAAHPHVRVGEPLFGTIPTVRLDRSGAAPVSIVLGPEVDVWIGPFSEVVVLDLDRTPRHRAREVLVDVLRSRVSIRRRRLWTTISLQLPESDQPWRSLQSAGTGGRSLPDDQDFEPFVR